MFTNVSKMVVVPLLLRWMLAAIFIYHGLALVQKNDAWGANWQGAPKSSSAGDSSADDGPGLETLPAPAQLAVAWGELLGGVAMAFGFLTRLAALGIIAIMLGAIARVHWPHGFDITKGGFEYNAAIIVMCVCLLLGGPGPIAVDRVFRMRRHYPPPNQPS
jgi:putative oxidoreductase